MKIKHEHVGSKIKVKPNYNQHSLLFYYKVTIMSKIKEDFTFDFLLPLKFGGKTLKLHQKRIVVSIYKRIQIIALKKKKNPNYSLQPCLNYYYFLNEKRKAETHYSWLNFVHFKFQSITYHLLYLIHKFKF